MATDPPRPPPLPPAAPPPLAPRSPKTPPPIPPAERRGVRFQTALPDDSVNAPTKGNAQVAITLLAILVALFIGGYWALGALGGWAARQVPVAVEVDVFAQSPEIFGADRAALAGPQGARVERVFAQLTFGPNLDPDWRWTLGVAPDPMPNAFAAPGGVIVVTRGLLDLTAGDDEALAFVLAHEVGHFAGRDHIEGMGRRLVLGVAAALVFGDSAFSWVVDTGRNLAELRYSRAQEREADQFALETLRLSFGTTAGAERFFALLRSEDLPAPPSYLSTHPALEERADAVRSAR